MKHVHLYDKELSDGMTVTVDHVVQTFTVTVRSLNRVGPQTIRDLLQKRLEVTHIEEGDGITYVL